MEKILSLLEEYSDYHIACRDFSLTNQQKIDFFHLLRDEEFKDYCLFNVESIQDKISSVLGKIEEHFDSSAQQVRALSWLRSIKILQFVNFVTSVTEALSKAYNKIVKFTQIIPEIYRDPEFK